MLQELNKLASTARRCSVSSGVDASEQRTLEVSGSPHDSEPQRARMRDPAARQKLMISVITVLEVEIGVCRLEWRDPAQGPMLRLTGA
jgi:hypothetical protein